MKTIKRFRLFFLLSPIILTWCEQSYNPDYYEATPAYDYDDYIADKEMQEYWFWTPQKSQWEWITIKYRDTRVDVSGFQTIDTSSSSFIRNAYYDAENNYLILNLDWTYYHWCDVPKYVRDDFKSSESLWKYYNKYIKWEYDCRNWFVPSY